MTTRRRHGQIGMSPCWPPFSGDGAAMTSLTPAERALLHLLGRRGGLLTAGEAATRSGCPLAEVEPGHFSRCWKAPLQTLAAQMPALESAA